MRERRVDLEGLGRDPSLPVGREHRERAHVVKPVGELDEQDADVARHRDDHLADVLSLLLLPATELERIQLREAVHDARDLLSELLLELLDRDIGVLHGVVQERGDERRRVEPEIREDLRHRQRVGDEVITRDALLALVVLLGEAVSALDLLQVRLRVVPTDRAEERLEVVTRRLRFARAGAQTRQDAASALLFDLLTAVHGGTSSGTPVYAGGRARRSAQ